MSQKGFAPILILVGILIIATVAGGAYYFGKNSSSLRGTNEKSDAAISPTSSPIYSPSPSMDETANPDSIGANWKTYTNIKYYTNFKYSPHLNIIEDDMDTDESNHAGLLINLYTNNEPGASNITISVRSLGFMNLEKTDNLYDKLSNVKVGENYNDPHGIYKRQPDIEINGVTGIVTTIEPGSMSLEGVQNEEVIFKKNGYYFSLSQSGFQNELNQILSTFRFD